MNKRGGAISVVIILILLVVIALLIFSDSFRAIVQTKLLSSLSSIKDLIIKR